MIKQVSSAEFDEPPSAPAIGEVIAGKYRVESIVGTGGMGVVLCATHLELGQKVAIKVLTVPEDDSRKREARERFLREGRATAALVSDHVVRVYDVGTLANDAPFMVMELLRGQDLAHTLQQSKTLGVELACDCVRQAAEAIACAHAQGIVHRDLKPSNLFLTQRSDGGALVKVLDFGISKSSNVEFERLSGDLTAERSVLGTPFYMSPEQVRDAKNVDVRTDIWSLGLILHELLSGSPAFEGATLPSVCAAIVADPPAALRLKRPEVPPEVEAIVLKCLEKDPAKRFQTARELFERLTPWTGHADNNLATPYSDATIRSSPLSLELAEMRDGSTLALPASDTGTLASAVFTKSGPGEVLSVSTVHSKADTTEPPARAQASPISSPAERVARSRTGTTIAIGGAALVLLTALFWALRSAPRAEHASALPGAASREPISPPSMLSQAPAALPSPAASPAFSLQIDSNPSGAQVFEGGRQLGSTPLHISIDAASVAQAPRTFTVHKSGYTPYTIVQGGSASDARVRAELAPEPSLSRPGPPMPAAKSAARDKLPAKPAASGGDIFMQR
jgi:serine/threonine-protein kinase